MWCFLVCTFQGFNWYTHIETFFTETHVPEAVDNFGINVFFHSILFYNIDTFSSINFFKKTFWNVHFWKVYVRNPIDWNIIEDTLVKYYALVRDPVLYTTYILYIFSYNLTVCILEQNIIYKIYIFINSRNIIGSLSLERHEMDRLVTSVVDPDPDWIRIQWGSRIQIQEGKMAHRKKKIVNRFIFWSAGCSHLRAKGFTCSLDVL